MIILNQNGLEWNDQGCLVGLYQATTATCMMVVATRSSMLHNDADLNWVQFFFCSVLFRSSIV